MSKHTLPMNTISDMVNNYRNNQLVSIENSTSFPWNFDAQSAWFSLEALKDFIATIEQEVSKHPEYPTSTLGIRLYYAAYPANEYAPEVGFEFPKEYANLHTLVAIPTKEIAGNNQDFNPADGKTYDGTKPTGFGISIMAENHSALCPPKCSSKLWF
jgi:hypothetical protein